MKSKTTGKQSKRHPLATKVEQTKPRSQGWSSTDAEEIERRRKRGAEEPIAIESLEPKQLFFGSFIANSQTGGGYLVEIRSLTELINSCECPDYQVNGLGICKHIEAVLLWVRKGRIRKYKRAAVEGSPRVEIYLDQRDRRISIAWPGVNFYDASIGRILEPFFSNDGGLLADPLTALPALQREIDKAPKELQAKIRLSRDLQPWLVEQRQRAEPKKAREAFLKDVEQGKRSLDPLSMPLYRYQQHGMLHLAFGERVLLADEMGLGKTVEAIAACELLRRLRDVRRVLVISPASLKTEWDMLL